MKALVLAAGRSKRMNPIEDKNFLEFLGKPLLMWQVEMVLGAGFEEVVVVGGAHNLNKINALLGDMAEVVEQKDLDAGMCGAVLAGKEKVADGGVMIFSSNDVVDQSAFEALKAAADGDASSYILGKKMEKYFPGGYLEIDEEGFLKNIIEKPGVGNEPSDMVNLVVHLHKDSAKLFEYLEKADSECDDLYEVALASMMKDGVKMKAVSYDGFWQPVKFPWHVQKVWAYLFDKAEKGVAASAVISDKAIVKGDVIIGENVKIFEGAIVNGPCYIGDGAVVANNALVRESNVGAGCVIGYATEVARSFLGRDVWTHSNYIGDSVIGNNVSFGAGTVTGNLRLDEKDIAGSGETKFGLVTGDNIRIGINTSFMPGVRIGSDCFIGAGILVAEDVEPKKFVRGSWELKISDNRDSAGGRDELKKKL